MAGTKTAQSIIAFTTIKRIFIQNMSLELHFIGRAGFFGIGPLFLVLHLPTFNKDTGFFLIILQFVDMLKI